MADGEIRARRRRRDSGRLCPRFLPELHDPIPPRSCTICSAGARRVLKGLVPETGKLAHPRSFLRDENPSTKCGSVPHPSRGARKAHANEFRKGSQTFTDYPIRRPRGHKY